MYQEQKIGGQNESIYKKNGESLEQELILVIYQKQSGIKNHDIYME